MTAPARQCDICDGDLLVAWTDTHGVAQCIRCGVPYRVYHYENDQRVEKPPECLAKPEAVPLLRRYYATFRRPVPSECSFGYRGQTQEVATRDDAEHFYEWWKREHEPTAPAGTAQTTEGGGL